MSLYLEYFVTEWIYLPLSFKNHHIITNRWTTCIKTTFLIQTTNRQ